jgi:hypothetical protein
VIHFQNGLVPYWNNRQFHFHQSSDHFIGSRWAERVSHTQPFKNRLFRFQRQLISFKVNNFFVEQFGAGRGQNPF